MTKHINLALSEKQYNQIKSIVKSGEYRNMSDFVRSCTVIQLEKIGSKNSTNTFNSSPAEYDPG